MNYTTSNENCKPVSEWLITDLRLSGLNDDTIAEMRIEEVPQGAAGIDKLKSVLGFSSWDGQNIPRLTESYILPYPAEGFCRIKLRNKLEDAKYLSPNKQTHDATHLYFLPSEKDKLRNPKYALLLTEGEKKTAKLTQELRALRPEIKATAIGIAGVTVWRDCVEWKAILPSLPGRDVFLLFDADFRENPVVAFELLKAWLWLWAKKANPKLMLWTGEKGIDDFLVAREKEGNNPSDVLKSLISEAQENIFDMVDVNAHKLADAVALILSYTDAQVLWETFQLKARYNLSFTAFKRLVKQRKENEREKKQGEISESPFVEKSFKTYKFYLDETTNSISEEEVANFTMRILSQIKDDEGKVSWGCSLSMPKGIESFELAGDELLILDFFRKRIAVRGAFIYNICSQKDHNEFVEYVLSKSKIQEKRKTEYLGRIAKESCLFNDALITPEGIKLITDIIPPRGRIRLGSGKDTNEGVLEYAVELTEDVYPEQSWKIWGFSLGSLFVEEIDEYFSFFPPLFLYGAPQSGKTTLARSITAQFGAHRELDPFNFSATTKALQRAGAKYKGIPITINEFQNTKNANALVCSLYDREGYQRARTDNTLDLQKAEVNATFIILSTQSIQGHEAEAVLSRVVQVNMDNAKKDVEIVQKLHAIEDKLSYFVVHCLTKIKPEALMKKIQETIAENRKHITGVSERILENYSIIQACANVFYASLGEKYLEKYGVNAGQIRKDVLEQQAETTSANVARSFLQVLMVLVKKGEMPGNIAQICKEVENEIVLFSLHESLPLVRRFCKSADIAIVDEKTLAKNLKVIGVEKKMDRGLDGTPRNVWRFVAPKNIDIT